MIITTGRELVYRLRQMCDRTKRRMWITTPYLGHVDAVLRILGSRWRDSKNLDVRLLIDADNAAVDPETLELFCEHARVKTLPALHAKIYICDDVALVTSANLTKTAFSKRHELGVFSGGRNAQEVAAVFDQWWSVSSEPTDQQIRRLERGAVNRQEEPVSRSSTSWPVHTTLPKPPPTATDVIPEFRTYNQFVRYYQDLATKYASCQRLAPRVPLFLEVDTFLEYLRRHESQAARRFRRDAPRRLTEEKRLHEIRKYARRFKKWLSKNEEARTWLLGRGRDCARIRRRLLSKSPAAFTQRDAEFIVDRLFAYPDARIRQAILNYNRPATLARAWRGLLEPADSLPVSMSKCKAKLVYFGRSGIQELAGVLWPDRYPIRNRTSNAGLRFFGYRVAAY